VSDFVVASFVPTHFPFNLSCHSYHLILLLRNGKPSDPLKGDAHVENTLSSLKLSDLGATRSYLFLPFTLGLDVVAKRLRSMVDKSEREP
jgi:hypothetical protein